ncbi:MAG: glycosyltransferase family 2 protein [Desulfobacteraceae bacterium]|jgi:glycosyltransferase involved in cell wall biosynthesis
MDLSIIIPFVGEYPQVLWTIQSIAQGLIETEIEFEIIAVDNYCEQAVRQCNVATQKAIDKLKQIYFNEGREIEASDMFEIHDMIPPIYKNRSGEAIKACARGNPWLRYVEYPDSLSHWQAKRVGVQESDGKVLLFVDAHTIPSVDAIEEMFLEYTRGSYNENGTMHLPLTYKILEWHRLIYKFFVENEFFYSYKFTPFRQAKEPYEVQCMSTCGMMISRSIYDQLGGWPATLGVYGGGENFMNYTLAVCGFKKWIYPHGTLFHHADRRDYHWYGDNLIYNRMLAHYLFGGKDLLAKFTSICKGRPSTLQMFAEMALKEGFDQRQQIKSIQKMTIEEWAEKWRENEL